MRRKRGFAAFTLIELFLVVIVVFVLASILLPTGTGNKQSATRIHCVNNLRQIGVAYQLWSMDNSNSVPTTASAAQGGLRETLVNPGQGNICWKNYAVMQAEFREAPKVLVCPTDERRPASRFIGKATSVEKGAEFKDNTSLSYFIGVGIDGNQPNGLLGGDRNLGPGLTSRDDYGFSSMNNQGNDVVLQTNSPVCWSLKMHSKGKPIGSGNLLMGDASTRQASSADFRSYYMPGIAKSSTNLAPSLRLIFP